MLGYLKDIFSSILILLLSAIVIPNIFKYIQVLLKLSLPLQIYRQSLDWPNLIYIVSLVCKSRFKYLDFFVSNRGAIGNIPKTIIFVDLINKATKITKELQLRLFEWIQNNKKQTEIIIHIFLSNFSSKIKTRFLVDL